MIGLGIARGLNEGMADIDARRRQEMLDRERQEDRARTAELHQQQQAEYQRQQAEYQRQLGLRTQREEAAALAMRPQEYSYQDPETADPEFGVAAQLQMGGASPEEAYQQTAGLRGGPAEFDQVRYDTEMARIARASGDYKAAAEIAKASKALRDEGGTEAVKLLIAGDVRGAERAWNSVGRDRIQPGTLKSDGKVVSFVNGKGQPVVMDLAKLKDLVGIAPADTGEYKTGEGVIYNNLTGKWELLPDKDAAAGGSGGNAWEKDPLYQRYSMAEKEAKDATAMYTAAVQAYEKNPTPETWKSVQAAAERLKQKQRDVDTMGDELSAKWKVPPSVLARESQAAEAAAKAMQDFETAYNNETPEGQETLRRERPDLYAKLLAAAEAMQDFETAYNNETPEGQETLRRAHPDLYAKLQEKEAKDAKAMQDFETAYNNETPEGQEKLRRERPDLYAKLQAKGAPPPPAGLGAAEIRRRDEDKRLAGLYGTEYVSPEDARSRADAEKLRKVTAEVQELEALMAKEGAPRKPSYYDGVTGSSVGVVQAAREALWRRKKREQEELQARISPPARGLQ